MKKNLVYTLAGYLLLSLTYFYDWYYSYVDVRWYKVG